MGTTKATRADPVACFELLQKLLVSIDRTERLRLKEYGRRCESALIDILLKGTAPPVGADDAGSERSFSCFALLG